MAPIKILDLRDTYEVGGPGKTILETYRAIDPNRFDLHLGVFLTRHETEQSPFVSAARAAGLPVHFIRGYNQYDPRLIWRLAKLVETLDIDIVHAHEVKSDVVTYLASRVRRVPIVTTLHGWFGSSLRHQMLVALDRLVARRFDCVIAVSAAMQQQMVSAGVPSSRLRLLRNAIVINRYRRTGERGFVKELLGREIPRPIISSIGRLSPEKGHADLVEAVARLIRRGYAMSLVLAGDGPCRRVLAQQIEAAGIAGSVHLAGYLTAPQRLLEDTDLMVLPSHTEGLPNVCLEALAMGVPVLATNVGGTPEVISEGETGRLVPPGSPVALATAIEAFLFDPAPWRVMAERGCRRVEAEFDFRARTRKLEDIYRQIAEPARA